MSNQNKKRKRILVALVCLLTVGIADARIPPMGMGWQEWTHYNAAGLAIGGVLYDCSGRKTSWGSSSGIASSELTEGPCSL